MDESRTKRADQEFEKKIQQAKEMLQESESSTAQNYDAILRKRAAQAAGERKKEETYTETITLLEFALGQERYGIPTKHLREILNSDGITDIPCTPAYIYGIMNLRGNIITIIDLKTFFKLDYIGFKDSASVIIVTFGDQITGIVADEVFGIAEVPLQQIQFEKPGMVKLDDSYIYGITDQTTIILNIDKVLGDKALLVDETVM